MTAPLIAWYRLDENLKPDEQPSVDLNRAVEIAEEFHARRADGEAVEQGEDAMRASVLGFSRSPSIFIEFSIDGASEISYRFEAAEAEASWLRKLLGGGVFQFETVLHSRAEMIQRVEEFFRDPPHAIRARLQGRTP